LIRKSISLATLLLAVALFFSQPASTKADYITANAMSGHNGNFELMSYVGGYGDANDAYGWALYYMADGTWIDGYLIGVSVKGNTATATSIGFIDDYTPCLCTYTVTNLSGSQKISLSVVDYYNQGLRYSSLSSGNADNMYGWISAGN